MELSNIERIPKKERDENENSMDQIRELPEELLVRILCSLSPKEAARTGVVSRVWRGLWKFITCSLKFEASRTFQPNLKGLRKERGDHNIDRWIKIALMKRVKRLELDFAPCRLIHWNDNGHYMFADRFCGSSDIKFLTSLCFKYVESIEVHASNLVSFEYSGDESIGLRIVLKYVPKFRDVSYDIPCGAPWDSIKGDFNFCQAFPSCLSVCVSQLVNLSLQFKANISSWGCPKLPNLRCLTCKVRDLFLLSRGALINLLSLVDSSTLLHKFRVELKQGYAIRLKKGSEAVGGSQEDTFGTREILVEKGCILKEIEPVYPPQNQTQFVMAYYVINYSKLLCGVFQDDILRRGYPSVRHEDGYFYAVMDCFCEKTWSHTPQYKIGYCKQCPNKVQWPLL
ncbi:Galactinol synthase 1 [Hibiscus syriacus]|uniref:Galactinol synthase 1 n=1 Tax=Hibiscus syriacus TaxID=106335 RepID=A0A6A3AR88_HIBSY|nr:Galactinol synthase 1 [Hibiscus syriacus]